MRFFLFSYIFMTFSYRLFQSEAISFNFIVLLSKAVFIGTHCWIYNSVYAHEINVLDFFFFFSYLIEKKNRKV